MPGLDPEELTTELLQHMLVAADRYDVEALRNECITRLLATLVPETVATTLILAHVHSMSALKEACMHFASQHVAAVTSSEGWSHLKVGIVQAEMKSRVDE